MQEINYKKLEETVSNILSSNLDFNYSYTCNGPEATKELGKIFGKYIKSGDIIVLNGELGSGKTVFMSGIASYFDIEDKISSPTFNIVNEYSTKNFPIYHFDVYRIKNENEFLYDIGTDYFFNGACIIEWGNIILKILPKNTIFIDISKDSDKENIRYFHIWREK